MKNNRIFISKRLANFLANVDGINHDIASMKYILEHFGSEDKVIEYFSSQQENPNMDYEREEYLFRLMY